MLDENAKDQKRQEIVIFTGKNGDVTLNADFAYQTIWATQAQIGNLFGIDRTTALRHINNILKDQEIDKESNVQKMHFAHSDKPILYYSLDIILSVGYRTNSSAAIAFRRWANTVLKQYLLQGYAVNQTRLTQLKQVIDIISRSDNPEIAGVSSVLERFTRGLDILDRYDHESLAKPQGTEKGMAKSSWQLTYAEGRILIDSMKFGDTSDLFGNEKDNSFKSAIGAVYQTFNGKDVYPTDQEKAANLLYLLVKNHAFIDGNKRIAAALFVYFLNKNDILFKENGYLVIDNNALAAITLMIALSHPQEKDMMCLLVMNMLESA